MSDGPESADEMTTSMAFRCPYCEGCHAGPCREAARSLGVLSPSATAADAPRPRGKRAAGKPWREEVAEMIDARLAQLALGVPCSDVHGIGAECALCNPHYVGGYSSSPLYFMSCLRIAHERLEAERKRPSWLQRLAEAWF